MAKAGLVPYVSTFAVFTSMRGLDQVHTDICYQNLDVKMIATHAGLSFGQAGTTHHCTEDIAIMRAMANMTVVVPADGWETANAVAAAYDRKGPVYIRINRGFDQVLYDGPDYGFELGKAVTLKEGTDLTLIRLRFHGLARLAGREDPREGGRVSRSASSTCTPSSRSDSAAIEAAVRETRRIVTVEDHSIVGGLGSAVAEVRGGHGQVLQLPPARHPGLLLHHRPP